MATPTPLLFLVVSSELWPLIITSSALPLLVSLPCTGLGSLSAILLASIRLSLVLPSFPDFAAQWPAGWRESRKLCEGD